MIDAPLDLVILVYYQDVLEAREKTSETCSSEERKFGCAIEVATLRQHPEFRAVNVGGTVAKVQFRDESIPDWRWVLERDGEIIAGLNDIRKEKLLEMDWPIEVRLVSTVAHIPDEDETTHRRRYTRSLAWGRSEEGKQAKRDSAERTSGGERGSYNKSSGKWRDGRRDTGFYVRED
jgi:hypothetical protein